MIKITDLLNKFKKTEPNTATVSTNGEAGGETGHQEIKQLKNWYEERHDNITVQRNLLFLLLLVLLCLSIVSIGVVAYVINTKRFDPFVIQIDDTTGIAKVVNPLTSTVLSGNEALAQYFIKKYIIARETYNPVDFSTEAKRVVRLLSANSIYWDYRGYLKNEAVDPTIKYGQKNTTYLVVKSWSKLADQKYIMRFSINETAGAMKVFNKIAVVEFQYLPMELTENDKDVNPVGFQVTGYRMDDDSS
jgi:type IV secretion system protein VirB8